MKRLLEFFGFKKKEKKPFPYTLSNMLHIAEWKVKNSKHKVLGPPPQ